MEAPAAAAEHAPALTRASATRAAVLAALAVLSLAANAATVASIRRGQRRGRRARARSHLHAVYALVLHLAVADLLVSAFCIAGEAAWSYTVAWLAGNALCKIFKFLQMFSLYLSTFVMVLIGVDRFVVVRYPMKSLGSPQRLNKLVLAAWLLSLVLSAPQLLIFHVERGPFVEEFYQCVTHGFYTEAWQEQLYTTLSLVCMFVLPLLVLLCTYVSTIVTIARSERAFRAEAVHSKAQGGGRLQAQGETWGANRRRLIHRAKLKSMRISVVIVAAFVIWWTPYYTMMIIFMFLNPDKHLSEDLQSWIFFFGMTNSLVNPIIYGAFHLWRPRKKAGGNCTKEFRHSSSFRSGVSLQRRSTVTNTVVVEPLCAACVVQSQICNGGGADAEAETTLVTVDEIGDERSLSVRFTHRYTRTAPPSSGGLLPS